MKEYTRKGEKEGEVLLTRSHHVSAQTSNRLGPRGHITMPDLFRMGGDLKPASSVTSTIEEWHPSTYSTVVRPVGLLRASP